MKYELEVVIPVNNTNPKYARRLNDFKEIGLVNIPKRKKIKVILLAKKGTLGQEFTKGWRKGCDVSIQYSDFDYHVYKLCNYYLNLTKFESKWYVGVDDDSTTDVGGLVRTLSAHDYQEPIYFSTWFWFSVMRPHPEIMFLKYLGILHLLKGDWRHDWESHYMSRAAIKQMLVHPTIRWYMERRKHFLYGCTDHFLPYAARIAKVPMRWAYFSDSYPAMNNYSLWGGDMNHIHYIAHDYTGNDVGSIKNWLKENG